MNEWAGAKAFNEGKQTLCTVQSLPTGREWISNEEGGNTLLA